MEHYVPVHPQLTDVMEGLCDGREGAESMFIWESFRKWLQKRRSPLARCNSHFVTSDLRKFVEQHGDVVGGMNLIGPKFLRMACVISSRVITGIRCLSRCIMFIFSIGKK